MADTGPASAYHLATATTDHTVITSDFAVLLGWSVRESAGTPAVSAVNIEDGSGDIVAVIELTANGSDTQWFGPNGIRCQGGIAVDRQSGETEGAIYFR